MRILFSQSFFAFLILAINFSASLSSCRSDRSQVSTYLSDKERDTLLVNVITYMGQVAPGADKANRFDIRFRHYYVQQLPKYKFENYTVTPDSTHYYFIIRPVGEGTLFKRGVGGRFKLNNGLKPVDFEEMWCTPHFKDDSTIQVRGGFLFSEMVRKGNISKYLSMKHYVEWPDSSLRYDKQQHEWVPTSAGTEKHYN